MIRAPVPVIWVISFGSLSQHRRQPAIYTIFAHNASHIGMLIKAQLPLTFCFSIFGLYGLVYYLCFLIPRYIIPYVSAVLAEAERLLDRAESTGVIPRPNGYRTALTFCASEFLQTRMESHRAPGILQQLWLAIRYGLTWKLYMLSLRVDVIKIRIELAIDERRLASLTATQSTTDTAMPTPTDIIVMTNDTAEPHPPSPPDATS